MSKISFPSVSLFRRDSRLDRLKRQKRQKNGVRSSQKKEVKPAWFNSLLLKLTAVGFVILIFSTIIFSVVAVFTLKAAVFPDRSESDVVEWDGQDNLNVLLIGVDRKSDELEFVDSLQLLYVQPNSGKVDILAIDPDLTFDILASDTDLGETVKSSYQYKQLLNYYKSEDFLNGTSIALEEFIFSIESELGLNIDRYILVEADEFSKVVQPFYRLPVDIREDVVIPGAKEEENIGTGSKRLTPDQQLKFVSADSKNPDTKLARQNEAITNYLLNIDNPVISMLFGYQIVFNGNFTNLIETNLSGGEVWRLYGITRGLKNIDLSSGITAEDEKFIVQGRKYLDKNIFDENIRSLYFNQPVVEEQARIDVINGSGRPGLASKTKRILTNHSFNIVRVDNSEEVYARNTLYVDEPNLYPETIHQLQLFYPDLEIKKQDYTHRPTGDMVLVVI